MTIADAAAVTLISLFSGTIPLFLGLFAARLASSSKKFFANYAAALSVGILLQIFFELLQETAGLQQASQDLLQKALTVILFLCGLVAINFRPMNKRNALVASTVGFGWAVGIGFHGFGEGIVIGYGFILGSAEYANLNQILSFGLHKIAEGFTLGALLVFARNKLDEWWKAGLIASVPVGVGGALGFSSNLALSLSTYTFALGAGFTAYILTAFSGKIPPQNRVAYFAVAVGFLIMYLAGLLHQQ